VTRRTTMITRTIKRWSRLPTMGPSVAPADPAGSRPRLA
jgi:hypothetical protein